MKTLKIATVPGTVIELAVTDDTNLQGALNQFVDELARQTDSPIDLAKYEVRINDAVVTDMQSSVSCGMRVYLVQKVKGNN